MRIEEEDDDAGRWCTVYMCRVVLRDVYTEAGRPDEKGGKKPTRENPGREEEREKEAPPPPNPPAPSPSPAPV